MGIYSFSFSPTGTSAKIVRGIGEGISQSLDADVNFCDLTHHIAEGAEFRSDDIVIVAAPVYGGKIAPIVKQRLNGISGNGAKCIVVAVYGNRAFEKAVTDFASFMSGCGFLICGAAAFVGEHSYSASDTPIAPGRPDRQDLADAKAFGEVIASRIRIGRLCEVSASLLTDEASPAESMVNFRNFVIGYQQRQAANPIAYIPEIDASLCDDCGCCYAVCPTEAISPDRREVDAAKCIKCCACVKICPQGARVFHSPFAKALSDNFGLRKSPKWVIC